MGDTVLLGGTKIGVVREKRQHGLVYIGDDAAIYSDAEDEGSNTLGHRAQIMRGRRIEIDETRTIPSLQIEAPKVMFKGQLAMSYNDDTVQVGLSPFLEPRWLARGAC
jgi:hypothetical protein